MLLFLVFASVGASLDKPIIGTCGSGLTACWVHFAAELAEGKETPAIYVVC